MVKIGPMECAYVWQCTKSDDTSQYRQAFSHRPVSNRNVGQAAVEIIFGGIGETYKPRHRIIWMTPKSEICFGIYREWYCDVGLQVTFGQNVVGRDGGSRTRKIPSPLTISCLPVGLSTTYFHQSYGIIYTLNYYALSTPLDYKSSSCGAYYLQLRE